jgi:hypothetical protein
MRLAWVAVIRSAWKDLGHLRNEVQQRKASVDEAFALAGLLGKGGGVITGQFEQPLEAREVSAYYTRTIG